MPQVIINKSYGALHFNDEVIALYKKRNPHNIVDLTDHDLLRQNVFVIGIVKEIGVMNSAGEYINVHETPGRPIKIVDIPDDVEWELCEYDGIEHIAEKHRTWH